jgi:hypothetical protein
LTYLYLTALFGFLLSFYTNPWIAQSGYSVAFGTMAAISGGCILFVIPFYIWGKKIRHASLNWPILRFTHWYDDRETGE